MSNQFKDLFISYGRRESLGLVGRLHQQLKLAGYDAWFDKVNIPDGDDYTLRINHGIESAHNFVYVMAPRCLTSPYCLIELEYAKVLGKRIIPVSHMVIYKTESQPLSEANQKMLSGFYQFHQVPAPQIKTTQDVLDRSHALLGKRDRLDAKEKMSDDDCKRLADWAKTYENHWAKHDDLNYLKEFKFPSEIVGQAIDTLDSVVERMTAVIERQKDYVHKHTEILSEALWWQENQKARQHLLVGKERTAAEEWLLTDFLPPKQPPCQPSALICEFICEARKNAENLMTDIFLCYDIEHDKAIRDQVISSLSRYAKTTWTHDRDIQKGYDYEGAIKQGIEKADNLLFFLSQHSVKSEFCQNELAHALKYNKRIVPLLIEAVPESDMQEALRSLQYVDFTDNQCQADYDSNIDDILNILRHDQEYYEQHKVLLARALKWQTENYKPSFLLRGHNLENAKTWLRLNDKRELHPPTKLHKKLIAESEAAKGQLGTEVFISYSRKDSDFARHLNISLQEAGKTTWFDQESISTGVDFEKEILKGIDGANNFVFVVSPDAVESEYCEREVNYASEQNKRFISVLHSETEPETMPEALRVINWIDFEKTEFDKSFPELIQAIELDRELAHQHTVLQQRASDWNENNKSGDFLLNNTACDNAEAWQTQAVEEEKTPAPTALQKEFVQESRRAIQKANRWRNVFFSLMGVLTILAVIASGFAFFQMGKAKESEQKAQKQAQIAEAEKQKAKEQTNEALKTQSLFLSDLSRQESEKNRTVNAMLLAIEGLPNTFPKHDRPYVSKTEENLYKAVLKHATSYSELLVLDGESAIYHVAFSPDGKTIVTAGREGAVHLWNANNGQLLHTLAGHTDRVLHVAFSPDGQRVITASRDNIVCLWQVKSGQIFHSLAGHTGPVYHAAFSPDGQRVITASRDNTARLWQVKSGQVLHTLVGHTDRVLHAAFSPDGQRVITSSDDNTARLWAVDSGQVLHTLAGHTSSVEHAAFSPDGQRVITASRDNTARLWQVKSGQVLHTLAGHTGPVSHAAFGPDGQRVITASMDGTARLWQVKSGQVLHTLAGHTGPVYYAAFSPDGQRVITASRDNTARLWQVKSGQFLHTLAGHTSSVYHAAFSPDGQRVITASNDGTARLWQVKSGQVLHTLAGHTGPVYHVAFSPDGQRVITASNDGTARLWAVDSGQVLHTLAGHTSSVEHAAFSPDGQRVITASRDNTARLWQVKSGQVLHTLVGHTNRVLHAAFSPDGQRVITVGDKIARLWQVKSGQVLHTLAGHTSSVYHAAFSPDGQRVITASIDGTARLWQVKSGQVLHTLAGHTYSVYHAAFSPDGQHVITSSSDDTARLWAVDSGQVLHTLAGHTNNVNHAAFSPDGRRVITASIDGTARLWQVKSGQFLHTLVGHTSSVYHAVFSPDGQRVITASRDNTARLWQVFTTETLIDHAYQTVSRCLTPKQREKFFLPASQGNTLFGEGKNLAREGKINEAIVKFNAAKKEAPCFKFDPESKAKRLAATVLMEIGKRLANRKFEEAITFLKIASKIDDRFNGLPLVANHYMRNGEQLANKGELEAAITEFQKAKELVPSLVFEPETKAKKLYAEKLVEQGR
jgi:WD40 repeat protein